MFDRWEIMRDARFWTRLEIEASGWLVSIPDENHRRFWIDGFNPESFTNTRRGLDVAGITWLGEGRRMMHQYRFVASIPQIHLGRSNREIKIEILSLDHPRQTLAIVIATSARGAQIAAT